MSKKMENSKIFLNLRRIVTLLIKNKLQENFILRLNMQNSSKLNIINRENKQM